jgi:hypothetical protein
LFYIAHLKVWNSCHEDSVCSIFKSLTYRYKGTEKNTCKLSSKSHQDESFCLILGAQELPSNAKTERNLSAIVIRVF